MVDAAALTHLGLVRRNNEDCFYASAQQGLCVLADGMGGALAGETASGVAVQTVAEIVASQPATAQLLEAAFVEADRRVRAASAANPAMRGMGTTLVAALDTGAGIAVANAGDSRCWLWEGGRLTLLTSDHSWVNEVGRGLGLSEQELGSHPLRHALTSAIGVGAERPVQTALIHPPAGSLILLSSDGLHGVVSDSAVAAVLASGLSLGDMCERLIQLALDAGGPDNVTAVLARL